MNDLSTTTPRQLVAGDQLLDLTLHDEQGNPVSTSEMRGSTTILYFYPADDSPGCTTQACSLRDSWPLLRSEGIAVYGVNGGDAERHARFKGRHSLPFALLTDEHHVLARAFGFVHPLPVMSGNLTRVERSTVIVNPDGSIRLVMRKVKASSHFDLLRVQLSLPDRVMDEPMPEVPVKEPGEQPVEPEPDQDV